MQLHIYIIALLVTTLQFSVQVTGSDATTTATSTHTTENVSQQTDSSTKQSHLDNKLISSDSKQINENEAIEPKVTMDHDTINKFEKILLNNLFGTSIRPKPSNDRSKDEIPESLLTLYASMMNDKHRESINLPKLGTNSAHIVSSFPHKESKIDERFVHHHHFRLYFNVSTIPANELLKAAELEIKRDPIPDGANLQHKVLVYDIIRPGTKGKTEPRLLLIDSKSVYINASETIRLDVMSAVDRWLKNPKENYGILVKVVVGIENLPPAHRHIRLRRSINEKEDEWSRKQPFLMTYTDDGRYKQRVIREIMTNGGRRSPHQRGKKRHGGRETCQRKSLYVDFQSVGWSDWIIAPTGYDAFYCHGDCHFPFADHLNTTNHAVVQTLVNSVNSDLAPKACCIPTQLKPITMLYKDDQNRYVLKSYQDMEVVGCGCR